MVVVDEVRVVKIASLANQNNFNQFIYAYPWLFAPA